MPLRDWAYPYLEQAAEDLRAARGSYAAGCPSSLCMLLQMTFEKLGKAAFARRTPVAAGQLMPPRNHQTATQLLLLLGRSPGGATLAPPANVRTAVLELERAHPAVVQQAVRQGLPQGPQLEFPWEDPQTGAVFWPARYLPIARRVGDPRDRIGAELLKFADGLLKSFNTVFPPHPP